jgi:outer membrane protein assembly factor BamB
MHPRCSLIASYLVLALLSGCDGNGNPAAAPSTERGEGVQKNDDAPKKSGDTAFNAVDDPKPAPGAPAGAADWPNFRGPHSSGISTEKDLPAKWSDKENLVWKIDVPGPGSSSPVVWGDRVFVTCYTGYGIPGKDPGDQEELHRHLLCVDRKVGKVLWDKDVKAKLPEPKYASFMANHGYASSTPATDGERVYVFYGKTGVFAYNFAGKELWQADVGEKDFYWGTGSSPMLYKEFVILNACVESGALVALNKKTGKEEWRTNDLKGCWGSPALVDVPGGKPELVLSFPNTMRGFNPDTGKELWNCNGIKESYLCPTVVSKDGIAYTIGARAKNALAVKAGGTDDVSKTNVLWTKNVGSNVVSPTIFEDHLYWADDGGMVYCLKAKDGEQVYAEKLDKAGGIYASVTIADGKMYVVTKKSGTYVLAAGPKFEELAHNTLSDDSIFNASPAVSQGQLFLRSDKALYCIGKK